MTEGKCAIWGTPATISNDGGPPEYDSPRAGGKYKLGTLYSSDFLQCGDEFKIKLTSWLVEKRSSGIESPDFSGGGEFYHKISNRNYLATSERINKFLVYCSLRKMRPGQMVFGFSFVYENNPKLHARRKLVLKNADESIYAYTESLSLEDFRGFASFLRNSGYLTEGNELTEQAFKRIEEFERVNIDSKQSFVAMWFDDKLKDVYENAIEPAIRDAGFEPRIIRNVEHNNKIDDEIVAEIRRSKFVIADFTCGFSKEGSEAIARGGVYYEAGFAQGLGLPVIWTCREDIISHVHFDTRQYNHIVWKDAADLKEKLLNRIRATIT